VLTVLGVAYPFAAVGPDSVGGAEQVLASIDARLIRDGHDSIVLATAGSRATGHVVTIPPHAGWIDGDARARAGAAYLRELARICDERQIDVVHFHGGDFAEYLPEFELPFVTTLHLPRAFYAPAALVTARVRRIYVSHAQQRTFGAEVESAGVIENGVAVERYQPATKADFVLALGRICPEKGFELALRAAREAGLPLVLAGAVFPYEDHHRHATSQIAPLLDADRRWVGPVGGARKRQLLAQARCLVVPSLVDETSSLVAMEALASGTPVVALRRGALPEIVEHGRTGWLVDHAGELPDALVRAARLSPAACRAAAQARFSATRMTSRYLELYHQLARPSRVRRRSPIDISIATTDAQLATLADAWDTLCDRCPSATPFQRPGWLLSWRRWFGAGGEPRVAILRRGGRLVGVIPLELRGGTVRLIGEGISDYLDAIVEPGVDGATLTDGVWRAAAGARAIELAALRSCSPLRRLALAGSLAGSTPSPVVMLDAARVPRRLAYEQRRLDRYAPRWQDETCAPRALLAGLFVLHRARWAMRAQPGVLDDPALARFHVDAATHLHRRGVVRLIGLVIEDRLRAVLYGFADHGRFLFYLSGFDPELARLSPGRLVIARALERARDDGAFELDFLRGCEPYKYEWGAVDRPASTFRATIEEDAHARDSLDHR
jgi:CelD/BcsL family acetyltransferase involved in cellulose biosynthesis/glycosyltransferase involved in cell wall biosynthesis